LNKIKLVPPCVKSEDSSATHSVSPVGALPDPRGSLSAAIPAKAISQSISKCRRQRKAWLELGKCNPCKYRLTLPSVIGKYGSQHGAAVAAQHFLRKLEEQGHTFNPFQCVSFCQYAQQ